MISDEMNFLRRLRKHKSLTLKELSMLTGISYAQLSKIERNIHTSPPEKVQKIQEVLFNYSSGNSEKNKEIINYPNIDLELRYATLVKCNSTCQCCGHSAPYKEIVVSPIDPYNFDQTRQLTALCEDCFIARKKFIEVNGIENDHIYKQNN